MIRTTKKTIRFNLKEIELPDGYQDQEYTFNIINIGSVITIFPTSDNQVLSFESIHDFLLAFSEIKN